MSDVPNPKQVAEEACHPSCLPQWTEYEHCVNRIEDQPGQHCQGWYLDYWSCIDKCATPKYFKDLA